MSNIKRSLFRTIARKISPVFYVKLQYKHITKHKLHLENPVRYTEKLQHLRLFEYPNNPLVVKCTSRDGAREYLKELGLSEYLIPTFGVFDSFRKINFSLLPNEFVLKCTHACGFNQIVLNKENKEDFKKRKSSKQFKKWLKTDYGKLTVEPHYSKIKPRILIEKYLGEKDVLPIEYKIHCFNGIAKSMYVVTGRGKDIRYNNYYIDWTPFDGSQFNGWKKTDYPLERPENWDKMVKIAEKISKNFPFVRVDLYNINGKIYFSEMTFTPAKGTLKFDDDRCDFEMGEWLKIN